MTELDYLLARADTHRERKTSLDYGTCLVCQRNWPCVTAELAAALRAQTAETERLRTWQLDPDADTERFSSHPDEPTASFADRLLLALGIWPHHAQEFGEDVAVDAAALIKAQAHRFPMAAEDFHYERERREDAEAEMEDRRRLDGLAVSHEALREQNTGLGVRVQQAWHRTEQAEEALAAMTAVAVKLHAGRIATVHQRWLKPDAHEPANRYTPMTDAEIGAMEIVVEALDALEANQ